MDEIPTPRPYQASALNNIQDLYPEQNRLLIAHATGLGKGLIPIWLAQEYPTHVKQHGLLFIAHRRKILFQAYERFQNAFGDDLWIGLEMGENEVTGHEDAIFMSIDSVGRVYQQRIRKYRDRDFGIILTDESHHLAQESKWDRVLNFFGVGSDQSRQREIEVKGYKCNPLAVHLTATPEDQMAPFVDQTAHTMSVLEGIERGWLTDIKSYHVKGADGVEGLVNAYERYLEGERAMIFASSVDESVEVMRTLNESGVANAAHIDAETPKDQRRDIYDAFTRGTITALSNRLVMTEGVDLPEATAILDNSPPSNQRLATQKWGRVVRPHPSANVDQWDTPAERKQAIRQSQKPFATLVCTYDPTQTGISLTQALTGRDLEVEENDRLVVEEVIEVLEEYEEEMPELDLESVDEFDPSNLEIREADIFRRTIYNDRLKGLTKLEWVCLNDEEMAICMPKNPFTSKYAYENAETVVHLRNPDDGPIERQIISGGWNGEFPAKVKTSGWKETSQQDMQEVIKSLDNWLWQNHSSVARKIIRGSSSEAPDYIKEHLKNKDIPIADDITEETARLLKADSKIRHKINKV